MARGTALLEHLPGLYRRGAHTLFDAWVGVVGAFLDTIDEDRSRVQRSHWVDQAFDRDDLARLGDLAGVPGEAWEPLDLYRERIKAMVRARREGSVTREVQERVLLRILRRAVTAVGVRACHLAPTRPDGRVFRDGPVPDAMVPDFVEWPARLHRSSDLIDRRGVIRRMDTFVAKNIGRDPVPLHVVFRGMPDNRTVHPVLVNVTTGQALGYDGTVYAGRDLQVVPDAFGGLTAHEGPTDRTGRLWTSQAWSDDGTFPPADEAPQALLLAPGDNVLGVWLLGRYDAPNVADRAGFSVPSFGPHGLRQGVFAGDASPGTGFAGPKGWDPTHGQSAFHEHPIVVLDAWWFLRQRGTFRFRIPRAAVVRDPRLNDDVAADEERLYALLERVVDDLRALGIDGGVDTKPLRDVQRSRDRLVVLRPDGTVERASAGEPDLVGKTALFDHGAYGPDRFA